MKGSIDYLKHKKRRYVRNILICSLLMVLMVISKSFVVDWLAKYLTIGTGIMIIPISLFLTKYVTLIPYHTDSKLLDMASNNPFLSERVLYDMLLVPEKRTFHLLGTACSNDEVIIYSKDKRLTSEIICRMFKKRACQVTCTIYDDADYFVDAVKTLDGDNDQIEQIIITKSL